MSPWNEVKAIRTHRGKTGVDDPRKLIELTQNSTMHRTHGRYGQIESYVSIKCSHSSELALWCIQTMENLHACYVLHSTLSANRSLSCVYISSKIAASTWGIYSTASSKTPANFLLYSSPIRQRVSNFSNEGIPLSSNVYTSLHFPRGQCTLAVQYYPPPCITLLIIK